MATRAQSAGTDTKTRLIEAASREFAARGYDGASLRQICASAGVTTGALYFFFRNKEDLFRTVVEPVVEPLRVMLGRIGAQGTADILVGMGLAGEGLPESVDRFLALCYERRSVVQIMVRNRETSVMEGVLGEVADTFSKAIRGHLTARGAGPGVWDDFVVGWLADLSLRSIVEILQEDESVDDARRHMQVALGFVAAGVAELRSREAAR